jgi:hypothetical protein
MSEPNTVPHPALSQAPSTQRTAPWIYTLAFMLGLVIGWLDTTMRTDDALPAILLLGIPCFVFSIIWSRHPWRWGLLIGIGIPLWHIVGTSLGYHAVSPAQPNRFASLLALAPAMIASYFGSAMRAWTSPRRHA